MNGTALRGDPAPPPTLSPFGTGTSGKAVDVLGPLLTQLLGCVAAALDPTVGRALVAPGGLVAWDDCCAGMVWTRLMAINAEPTTAAKLGASNFDPCGVRWTASIGVGALRCSAAVDEQGGIASAAALTTEAVQVTADAAALCQAVYCCNLLPLARQQVLRWDPLGPDGGCVGGEWTVNLQVNNYGCTDT
jgi:hypothetical protein